MQYYPSRRVNEFKPLEDLIAEDSKLKYIYDNECFVLNVDGVDYKLESQILKKFREIIYITPESDINLYIKNDLLDQECDYPNNNSLYMILLSGNLIQYGDEGRTKQEHIATHQVYKGVLERNESDRDGFFKYNITNMIKEYGKYLDQDNPNNIFFTTSSVFSCWNSFHTVTLIMFFSFSAIACNTTGTHFISLLFICNYSK